MLYPNLFHWILKIALLFSNNPTIAVESIVIFSFSIQLHALYLFIKRIIVKSNLLKLLAFLATVFYMVGSHNGSQMGSFLGTLVAGGGPGALGTALLLYLFSANNWLMESLLMGLLFLTHPLTALVGLGYLIVKITIALFQRNIPKFARAISALIISAVIGLPWILLSMDSSLNSIALNSPSSRTPTFPWEIVVIIFLMLQNRKKITPYLIIGLIISLLVHLPASATQLTLKLGMRGIPFYRFAWYKWILIIPLLFSWIESELLLKQWINKLNKLAFWFITSITLLLILNTSNNRQTTFLSIDLSPIQYLSGRVIDASSIAASLDFSQAMEHAIVADTPLIGSTRWFFESGSQGYLFDSLKTAIDPDSFNDGTSKALFVKPDNSPIVPIDIETTADLLGVNYYTFTSDDKQDNQETKKIGEFRIGQVNGESKILPYYIKTISDELLVTTLDTIPGFDPNVDLMTWWGETDHKTLVTDEEYPNDSNFNLNQPNVLDIEIKPTRISFFVEGDRPAPVFVKFSYSPYWEAKVVDGNGVTSKPYWITPGNMLVYGYGHIQLDWKTPLYMKMSSVFSVGFVGLSIIILIINKRRPVPGLQLENQPL